MKRLIALLVSAATIVAAPAAADPGAVSIRKPEAFRALLTELGYKPGAIQNVGKVPVFAVEIATQPTNFSFGGCTNFVDCKYIVMSSSYTDVPNPPDSWITAMNDKFDVLKIGRDNEKALYFSATHIIEGVPRATLREILESWDTDATSLAQEALTAKLNTK
jgi:hypothetical protein